MRIVSSGHFSVEDAETVLKEMNPGGSMVGMPRLVLTRQMTSAAPEARRLFGGRPEEGDEEAWVATTNFLIRVNRSKRVRLFSGEPEAVQWMDERTREEPPRTT